MECIMNALKTTFLTLVFTLALLRNLKINTHLEGNAWPNILFALYAFVKKNLRKQVDNKDINIRAKFNSKNFTIRAKLFYYAEPRKGDTTVDESGITAQSFIQTH